MLQHQDSLLSQHVNISVSTSCGLATQCTHVHLLVMLSQAQPLGACSGIPQLAWLLYSETGSDGEHTAPAYTGNPDRPPRSQCCSSIARGGRWGLWSRPKKRTLTRNGLGMNPTWNQHLPFGTFFALVWEERGLQPGAGISGAQVKDK